MFESLKRFKLGLMAVMAALSTYTSAQTYAQAGVGSYRQVGHVAGRVLGLEVGHTYKHLDAALGVFEATLERGSYSTKWSGISGNVSLHTNPFGPATAFVVYGANQLQNGNFNDYAGLGLAFHLKPVQMSFTVTSDGRITTNMLLIKIRTTVLE